MFSLKFKPIGITVCRGNYYKVSGNQLFSGRGTKISLSWVRRDIRRAELS